MVTIAIIEDEPAIREEICWMIQQEQEMNIVGWSDNIKEATALIEKERPDIVLMDIQLTDGSAFDILVSLKELPENIIFITAYNQFAIKAIKFGALDYLLKPIVQEELHEALQRYHNRKTKELHLAERLAIAQQSLDTAGLPESIALHSINAVDIIQVKDIMYCKGDGPYTYFYMAGNIKMAVSKPLKFYEEMLPAPHFLRTHQSYLVNRNYIEKVSRSEYLILKNKEEIPVSSRRKHYVLSTLNI